MRLRWTPSPWLPLSFALLALASTSHVLEAQAPRRRASAAQIRDAGAAFVAGVAVVSDNPSAFTQDVAMNGCEASITTRRRDKSDSLLEIHIFDAGNLTARSPERISLDATTGAIMFRFPTVNAAATVLRTRRRVPDAAGGPAVPVEEQEQVSELLILVANTSQQYEVGAFQSGWKGLLQACGGDPANVGDPAK
jgi:hypothetical protein